MSYLPGSFLKAFLRALQREKPPVIVPHKLTFLSHHKCGTEWFGRILKTIANDNGLSLHISHIIAGRPSPEHDISFLTNALYSNIASSFSGSAFHIIRNPMSIVLSGYHSHLSSHPTEGWPELLPHREKLRAMGREEGMMETIKFLERDDGKTNECCLRALEIWNYDDDRIVTVRLEDLTSNWPITITKFLAANDVLDVKLPAEKLFTFKAMSGGRKIGQIDNGSHFRSGNPNAWVDELPKSIQDYVRKKYKPLLKRYYPEALL